MLYKTLVRPEHLNHNGVLFGGYMLLWIDEYAYIAALEEFPGSHFVTRAVEAASFFQSVADGSVLTFDVQRQKTGTTSVTYEIHVTAMEPPSGKTQNVFNTHVTMVNTDGKGNKAPLPPLATK